MTQVKQALQQIPLSKLVPSEANVRRSGRTERIKELAASIQAHGLLQNLTVRRVVKGKAETVLFEVIAGGRRLAALKSLVKKKALKKDARIPCHVVNGDEGAAVEISLAENVNQCPMHPADQYEAFAKLHREHGLSAEDIAARFGVTAAVVKQRLKLGAVSPKLMKAYRDEELTLDELTAFAITDDHARQEQVWAQLADYQRDRRTILECLTEGQIPSDDRRARFVGIEAYTEAAGVITRDLFDAEDGGYLADAALLNRLVRDRLQAVASTILAEGWKWVLVEPEFDYPMTASMRRIRPVEAALSEEDQAKLDALEARYNALADSEEGDESVAEEAAMLETEIEALTGREDYRLDDKAIAGAFVSLSHDGSPRIERGFVRPEDQRKDDSAEGEAEANGGKPAAGAKPLSDKLVAELTAHRTAALRNELAQAPELALIAVTHTLAASTFYFGANPSCLEIGMKSTALSTYAPGIDESVAGLALAERHEAWERRLPEEPEQLWSFVASLNMDDLMKLLAHCTSLTLNAVKLPHQRTEATREAQAAALAHATGLDIARYWKPTAESYLGRVSKERILDAVREGAGENAARRIADFKKQAMAARAEELLKDSGWLPALLRPAAVTANADITIDSDDEAEPDDAGANMDELADA